MPMAFVVKIVICHRNNRCCFIRNDWFYGKSNSKLVLFAIAIALPAHKLHWAFLFLCFMCGILFARQKFAWRLCFFFSLWLIDNFTSSNGKKMQSHEVEEMFRLSCEFPKWSKIYDKCFVCSSCFLPAHKTKTEKNRTHFFNL